MAFSQEKFEAVSSRPFLITKTVITIDTEASGDTLAVDHYGPAGRAPLFCLFRVTAAGTDGSPVVNQYSFDTANDEVDVVLGDAEAISSAEDLEGATIEMLCFFENVAPANRT